MDIFNFLLVNGNIGKKSNVKIRDKILESEKFKREMGNEEKLQNDLIISSFTWEKKRKKIISWRIKQKKLTERDSLLSNWNW